MRFFAWVCSFARSCALQRGRSESRVLRGVSGVLHASGGLGSGFLCQFSMVFLVVARRCVVRVEFVAPSAPEVGGMSRRL